MKPHRPKVEMVPTSSLVPNPRNARKHSDKQVAQIGASIERSGFLVPIVADEKNMIAAGHGRWLAAMKRQLAEVPVIRAHFLSDEDRRLFALADNRLAELSDWDDDLLKAELTDLFELGVDISITGFSTNDIEFAVPEDHSEKAEDEVELPDTTVASVSREGDLWEIGQHRLICGDARDPRVYERLLGDELADIVVADPPYNIPIGGFVRGGSRHSEFRMASGEMSPAEFTAFLRSIFRNCVRFSHNGSIHYHFMDWRHIREILDAADGVYGAFKMLLVWIKGTGGMGGFYRSEHELVFVFKSGTAKHTNNFGLGETGRYRTNVLRYPGVNAFRRGGKADLDAHATVKPVAMIADFLLDCSNRGDLALDPTAGSGTLLLAANRTGRRGAAIEIEPRFVDTALKRMTAVSGLTPRLAEDGRSFDEIAAIRSAEEGEG